MLSLSNRTALALVLVFAVGLALFLLVPPLLDRSRTPDGIAAALDGNPDIRQTIAALRTHYPGEYRALIERLAARAQAGAGQPALDREATLFMQAFMATKTGAIASAPEARLRDIAHAYVELIRTLGARDPETCARFVAGRMPEGAEPPRAVTVRLDRISALRIRAAREGERGRRPPRAGPSEADRNAWLARMTRIDPASAALLAGRALEHAPPAAQCRTGLLLYRAAAELPPGQAGNVIAGLLAGAAR